MRVLQHAVTAEGLKTWAHLPDPKKYEEAMSRPDAELWKKAFNKEHEAFHRLKVMEHGHTIESARAAGATTRPVPMKHVLCIKRDPLGNYQKHKVRLVMCGHRGFMIPGAVGRRGAVHAWMQAHAWDSMADS